DLSIIDKLWVKYSDGRFGFSVQKRIYQGLGGTREYNLERWLKFGDKVGWRKGGSWLYYSDITFDKKAPEGHLPTSPAYVIRRFGGWVTLQGEGAVSSLASRLVNCNI
ncbi:MAG: GUN4 domain-containing protein, partial [Dolichospermum sp.]